MATVKRIGPRSAFMVGLVTYAILGLIVGAIIACFSLVKGADTGGRPFGFVFGSGAVIFFPIIYGISGAICGGLERQSTTSWLAGSVGSRWTSANPSTIEAVQARKWQRLRTQSTKRHSFWNAKTGSGRGEVTLAQIARDESLSSNGRPAGAPTPERGTVWAHWSSPPR